MFTTTEFTKIASTKRGTYYNVSRDRASRGTVTLSDDNGMVAVRIKGQAGKTLHVDEAAAFAWIDTVLGR